MAVPAGIVFDIQRFALHDGPGIRTTVFLKGCPLRCVWCHNPESWSARPQLSFRDELCAGCGACEAAEDCVASCPHGALQRIGRRTSVDDVMEEVLRDEAYYARTGGGLTLSGGEPLTQPRFARALLHAAHVHGVHTCVDTSGIAPRRVFEALAADVDLYLYDYKATDPARHRALTGVGPERILDNLAWLYERGARIVLRCPLVPGVNDSADHLAGIAALSARYPALDAVEILPYHAMGRDKADRLGIFNPLADLPTTDDATVAGWLDALHGLGCTRARRGWAD